MPDGRRRRADEAAFPAELDPPLSGSFNVVCLRAGLIGDLGGGGVAPSIWRASALSLPWMAKSLKRAPSIRKWRRRRRAKAWPRKSAPTASACGACLFGEAEHRGGPARRGTAIFSANA